MVDEPIPQSDAPVTEPEAPTPEPGPQDFVPAGWREAYFSKDHPQHEEAINLVRQKMLLQTKQDDDAELDAMGGKDAIPPDEQRPSVELPALSAGKEWDDGLTTELIAVAASAGIPAADLTEGLNYFAAHGSGEIPTAEAAEQTLRGIWKGDYENKIAAAKEAVRPFPGLIEYLDRTGLGNSPAILQWLAARGASRAGIQKEIDELSATPEYRDGSHVRHADVVEQVRLKYRALYAGH